MSWLRPVALLSLGSLLAGCGTTPDWQGDLAPSRVTIRGLISIARSGEPRLVDCGSTLRYEVGRMSAGNLLYLRRRVSELTRRTPGPVTAEISGHIRKASGGFRIDRPALVYLAPGRCVDAVDADQDYR